MKNKLLITSFESCSENGFWAKGLCDSLLSKNNCVIRNLPDFLSLNQYDEELSPLTSEKSDDIDTIIQYVPIDDMEYHSDYKNIFIPDIKHFPKRNLSKLDKLSVADEIWVFDDQYKDFLGDSLKEKTKTIGYPYAKNRVAKLFDNKKKDKNNKQIFYTITDISNIENIESLIFNFILVFHKIDTNLTIYLKNENGLELDDIIKSLLEKIKNQFKFIDSSVIDGLLTIISGNPYADIDQHIECHILGDCYINIDYIVNPDIFTASYLGKYILSIMNIKNILTYSPDSLIETTPSNYRVFHGDKIYFNELNSYPKINDVAIQDKLVKIYESIKNKVGPQKCYESFEENGFFK